jgi:aminomethyltransferase
LKKDDQPVSLQKKEILRTPLYDWHVRHRARMTEFGNWEMPLWYPAGPIKEHRTVITRVGLFDTSHMAVLTVSGPGAFDLLQYTFTKDLAALPAGRCTYGAFLNEQGEVIDDAIIYYVRSDTFLVVVNSGMGGEIIGHLRTHLYGRAIRLMDLNMKLGKVDLQGPLSARCLMKLLHEPESLLEGMPYFSFKGDFHESSPGSDAVRFYTGIPILLSRTGYTGEFGFEIFVASDHLIETWEALMAAGEEFGVLPCGLASRDSLRTGAMLPLSHQDMGPWPFINHPWSFALPYNDDRTGFTKQFLGSDAITEMEQAEHTYAYVGYDPRKISIHDGGVVLDLNGREMGVVLTCVADMAIDRVHDRIVSLASPDQPHDFNPRGLCCGFIRVKIRLDPGQIIELKDLRRSIRVTIVDDIRPHRTARHPINEFL